MKEFEEIKFSSKEMVNQLNKQRDSITVNITVPKFNITSREEKYCKFLKELHTLTYKTGQYTNVRELAGKYKLSNTVGFLLGRRNIINSLAGRGSCWVSLAEPNLVLARLLIQDVKDYNNTVKRKPAKEEPVLEEKVVETNSEVVLNQNTGEVVLSKTSTNNEELLPIRERIFVTLTELYNDSNKQISSTSFTSHIGKNRIHPTCGKLFYSNKVIQRVGNKFIWTYKSAPTMELAKMIENQYRKPRAKYNRVNSVKKSNKKPTLFSLFVNLFKNLFIS